MSLRMALVTQFSPWYLPRAPLKWFSPLDEIISLYFFYFFNVFCVTRRLFARFSPSNDFFFIYNFFVFLNFLYF